MLFMVLVLAVVVVVVAVVVVVVVVGENPRNAGEVIVSLCRVGFSVATFLLAFSSSLQSLFFLCFTILSLKPPSLLSFFPLLLLTSSFLPLHFLPFPNPSSLPLINPCPSLSVPYQRACYTPSPNNRQLTTQEIIRKCRRKRGQ